MLTLNYIVAGFILFPVLAVCLFGWGTLSGKICNISFRKDTSWEEKILMGFFCLFLVGGIWNFFIKTGLLFAIVFLVLGAVFALLFRDDRKWEKRDGVLVVPFLIFVLFSIGKMTVYDANLYYLDTIRWINEYAVVPGLANLHGRLGFNQFYFYFPAMLEAILPGYGMSFANPFIGFVAASFFIHFGRSPSLKWLSALMLACVFAYSFRGELSSASPDSAITFFMLIMLSGFVRQLKDKQPGNFTFYLFLTVICVLTKLSGTITALSILCIVFYQEQEKRKTLLYSLPPVFLLVGIWFLRSIFLTGYLIYPVVYTGIKVPWKLTEEAVKNEYSSIVGWARMPGAHYSKAAMSGISYWLKTYLMEKGHIFLTYFRFFVVAVALWGYFADKTKEKIKILLLLYIPIIAGFIFWWCSAPDPRFAHFLLFFSVLYPVAAAFEKFHCSRLAYWLIFTAVFLILLPPLAAPKFLSQIFLQGGRIRQERLYDTKTTDHGVIVNVTWDLAEGEMKQRNMGKLSGKPPLPSTPYFNANLKLRGKNIQDGFLLQKKSEMQK